MSSIDEPDVPVISLDPNKRVEVSEDSEVIIGSEGGSETSGTICNGAITFAGELDAGPGHEEP
jgi:hypothetical protein